jgi:hypothetical protein
MSGSVGDNPYRASGVIAAAAGGGGVSWQDITTGTTLTAVAGNGYPINTTSNACTITLPASASVGDQIIFTDYLRTWATNAITLDQNSLNFQGVSDVGPIYNTNGQSVHIVYVDATQGWIPITDDDVSYEVASTFDYLVVGGGGAGGSGSDDNSNATGGGGGGAGGYRTGTGFEFTDSAVYSVVVGAGGPGVPHSNNGDDGSLSSLIGTGLSITSAGGGGGGMENNPGRAGGSGGGAGGANPTIATVGSGDTPNVTPDQGYDGGGTVTGGTCHEGGGGGGASVEGGTGDNAITGAGIGGDGVSNSITGSAVTYAGGGGSGVHGASGCIGSAGGAGGGGAGGNMPSGGGGSGAGVAGIDGLGGGGGGGGGQSPYALSGTGGDGVVIIRIAASAYSGITSGSPDVSDDGIFKVIKFTAATGSYTA